MPVLIALLAIVSMASIAPAQASTQTTSFSKTFTADNIQTTVSGTVTVDTTAKTLSASLSLRAVNTTSGAVIFSRNFTITLFFDQSNSIKFSLAVAQPSLTLGVNCSIATGSSASCTVSRVADVDHDGSVDISDLAKVASAFGSAQGSQQFGFGVDLNGDGVVNIADLAIVASQFGANFGPMFF